MLTLGLTKRGAITPIFQGHPQAEIQRVSPTLEQGVSGTKAIVHLF